MKRKKSRVLVFVMLSVTMLIFSSIIDYSFFIMFVTAATIYLGLTIYGIAFYSREFTKGSNYLYIGIAYLFGYLKGAIRGKKIEDEEIRRYFRNKWKKYL